MYICPIGTFAYTVKSGDTLYDIARRHNTTVDILISYNPFIDPERLSIGQMICIPLGGSGYDFNTSTICNFVTVKPGDTLNEYSRIYNIPVEAIIEANPGIIPNNLRIGQVVCIPRSNLGSEELTRQNISDLPTCISVKVRDGDYPYVIAQRYKTTVEEILRVNPHISPTNLKVGQEICVPVNKANYSLLLKETQPSSYTCISHVVKKGDTFKDLAKEFNVTINSILTANPGADPNELQVGQVICIPKPVTTPESSITYQNMTEEREKALPFCLNYTIKKGDTFRDLARKFNTTIEAIMLANPNSDPYDLQIGQVICIPQIQAVNCIYRTIRQGDTFNELARIYNVDVEAIINANPNLNPNNLPIGQVVCIPITTTSNENRHDKKCLKYKIEQGDTLVKLSRKYNTTVDALLLANPGVNPNNLKIGSVICIPIEPEMMKKTLVDLNKRLRVLWANHSIYDNLLILSIVYDLPILPMIEKRLLRNPTDFKEVLIPFYGEANASRFAHFLTNHINLGEDLFINLKRNDIERANIIERDLLANAEQISRFLASINSMWSQQEWYRLLANHVRLSRQLMEHYLNSSFDEAINLMEEDYANSLFMGDLMSEGIIKQFPKQF